MRERNKNQYYYRPYELRGEWPNGLFGLSGVEWSIRGWTAGGSERGEGTFAGSAVKRECVSYISTDNGKDDLRCQGCHD